MAVTPTRADAVTCSRHRRKGAVGRCVSCSAPLCRECMVDTRVGFKCGRCAGSASAPAKGWPRWARPAVTAVIVAVVAVLGLVALGQDGGRNGAGPPDDAGRTGVAAGPVERRVQFEGAGDVTIGGTLSIPPAASADAPVAGIVIIPGFGPTTREGVAFPGRIPDTLYRDVSDLLVDDGMATLRYDKRGTGQSVLAPEQALAFDDMVADAEAAVSFLAERAEVDPERIGVVGHEEGGLVGLRLAATDARVESLALVSVPGRPLLDVVTDDFTNSGHGDEVDALRSAVMALVSGGPLPAPADMPPFVRDFFPADQQGYLREIFSLDPVTLAGEVDIPVLIVRGAAATGVSAADASALSGALGPDTEVVVADGAGPTLRVEPGTGGDADPANPRSPSHDHGGGGPAQVASRAQPAMARISEFLATTT
jgi:dienelactone hydrolase